MSRRTHARLTENYRNMEDSGAAYVGRAMRKKFPNKVTYSVGGCMMQQCGCHHTAHYLRDSQKSAGHSILLCGCIRRARWSGTMQTLNSTASYMKTTTGAARALGCHSVRANSRLPIL